MFIFKSKTMLPPSPGGGVDHFLPFNCSLVIHDMSVLIVPRHKSSVNMISMSDEGEIRV